MPCPFHDPLGVIARHALGRVSVRVTRRRGLHAFLDIDQTEIVAFYRTAVDVQQHRIPQPSKRAASFHPIGGIDNGDVFFIGVLAQSGCYIRNLALLEERVYFSALGLVEWPETLAEGNARFNIFN